MAQKAVPLNALRKTACFLAKFAASLLIYCFLVLTCEYEKTSVVEVCRFLLLFACFFAQQIFEQGAHIIAAAIQNTVNADIAALHTVKHHIVAADKKTIVCSYIYNGG